MPLPAIPIIGGLLERLFGIGEKVVDRIVPDKNKRQDQAHEGRQQQGAITLEEAKGLKWSPRRILLTVLIVPVGLNFGVKPVIEWVSIVVGHPVKLPGIDPETIQVAVKLLVASFGLDLLGG